MICNIVIIIIPYFDSNEQSLQTMCFRNNNFYKVKVRLKKPFVK